MLRKFLVESPLIVHADATFKLTLYSFPVLCVGTSDRNGVFHPVGIALTS